MKFSDRIKAFPGGSMLFPMALAAIINTVFPQIRALGFPTSALFSSSGTMALIAMILCLIGLQFRLEQLKVLVKSGGIIIFLKLLISIISGYFILHYFGLNGFWGISALALVAAISSVNPGIYLALMKSYGDDNDISYFTLLNLIGLPFVPISILGFTSGNGIDYISIVSTLVPFLIGVVLRSHDAGFEKYTDKGIKLLIPFLGFCLGANINLTVAFKAVGTGILLLIIFLIVNNVVLLVIERYIFKRDGYLSIAISCIAGLSIAVPELMAELDPVYLPYVEAAKSQVAFAAIFSALIVPLWVKRLKTEGLMD
nr:2-keto-3-deoxygluconate permease [uncultured Draconibacterium sp.]